MEKSLCYRGDGTFTIVQFTDLHWQNGEPDDQLTRILMERVLEAETLDLVLFTGDVIYSKNCEDPRQSFREAVKAVDSRGIPWAAVFGNHDTEHLVTRAELMDVQLEHRCCVAEAGPAELSGEGNAVLFVRDPESGEPVNALYLFDSGSYSEVPHIMGYQWIQRDQIAWYTARSAAISAANGGVPLPSLAFFHIPLPEYKQVWKKELCFGSKHEGVACAPVNSGLFAAMLEMGDVVGTFCGHDHVNDYWGALHDIRLCYGRATGFQTYGREGFPRGARIIKLERDARDFATYVRLDDGTVIREPKEHYPKGMES
ncbi:metallophosphoesterase family protein [Paenibacillus sacheonensis]|uniref:Metallophosphoesterase n=1 Tax=Paenibacillus sacheonensis TaxID=742054 RepID=A0A7X4YLL4_9BACL|nr:metallophosphoesterase family protein [Paenibacillus sacheonensis]MBM7568266.1 3',5'-cyclic AMP phosphodiesterase CpdA [Paenibacillus sacheonensis]NBC68547.1 metallophosphoesterase [Paenibacillus sacheonensis]